MQKYLSFFCMVIGIVAIGQIREAGACPLPRQPIFSSVEKTKFFATVELLDAAINSINSLNSLIKKENYRNKIAAFNNPASSDLGFNLEVEIQNAIRPLMEKAKATNTGKFSGIVSSLINGAIKSPAINAGFGPSGIFSTLLGLVGNLTLTERKITRQDLDSFILSTNKYFIQYEKMDGANKKFDENINKFMFKLQELQFDIREYIQDMVVVLNGDTARPQLKSLSLESLMLKYLEKNILEKKFNAGFSAKYPGDGIKTAKEIVNDIQKLFAQYQEIFTDNFSEIRAILQQSKETIKNIDIKQVDLSLQQLETLYESCKEADILNLRLGTLLERLRLLIATEQMRE